MWEYFRIRGWRAYVRRGIRKGKFGPDVIKVIAETIK